MVCPCNRDDDFLVILIEMEAVELAARFIDTFFGGGCSRRLLASDFKDQQMIRVDEVSCQEVLWVKLG